MAEQELIEEYTQQIELCKQKQKNIDKKIERLQEEWCKTNCEIAEFENKINAIKADIFKHECTEGKHKTVKWRDLPEDLKYELEKIENRINRGCKGDWYDGCRGCSEKCHRKAKEEFMTKYNIKKIDL